MSIRIITDSASDITKAEAKELGIEMISIEVNINGNIYYYGDTITVDEFYNELENVKILPKTSQINPYRFKEFFDNIVDNNDQAIVILLSSKLSGTYNNAKLLENDYDNNIYVVDSLNAAIGERLLVLYAIKLVKENKSFEEIIELLEREKYNIVLNARVDTLKYLRMGGRISSFVAFAGETLHIKPIVGVVNGEVKMLGKARGVQSSNKIVTQMVLDAGGIDENKPFGVIYSGNNDVMINEYLNKNKESILPNKDVPIYRLGCTIGTHIGPNAVGVAFFKK